MQSTYNEKYPDVVALKEQIRGLEAKIAQDAPAAAPAPAPTRPKGGRELKAAPQNPYIVNLMQQLDQATVESKASTDEIRGLNTQIAMYQRRIENTPRREQELSLITRDYETTRDLFRSLLSKREEAGIAADLEAKNKGERFRIIEGAGMPERPTGPNRLRLLMVGMVLALAAAAVAVVLAEQVDTSYRTVREALAQLIYGVRERKGFIVLTGEIGTGKTTLLRTLLERLDDEHPVAYVHNSSLPWEGMLEYILHDWGVKTIGTSQAQRLVDLNE